ncbi:siderophore ABC transporter substrate-binding protein [Corynebacterium sp. CCM 9185]|uniref:Siderophore ABC transporter substrate-binding protein n=1 Tax=Corynebacterium marambiense TaxID=2765364 RepID=A0ABS0VV13_9CORY|nr:siderophore ABC transporter substrate-binding protein [Corynebacterium marambiense]MBI9000607.1 siderophore ABC transporter substrate-binding protein [Corynebacterium marambiense]MCK7663130.1 siderophore ABC transporter substrate-binding protein [Corynebacterium marambiense]MCX7542744.1 siderophore ABC transporter substrate-binding protein [Corynebacterium marambiense]
MTIRTRVTAVAAVAAFALAGCSSADDDADQNATTGSSSASSATTKSDDGKVAAQYPVTVKHRQGETEIKAEPQKIVAMNYSGVDYLVSIGYGDRIVGVTSAGAAPEILDGFQDKQTIGSFREPDYEAIASLEPDLIVIGGRTAGTYEQMSEIAPTIDVTVEYDDYLKSNAESAEMVGAAFGVGDKAEEKAEELKKKADDYKKKISAGAPTALVIMTNGGELSTYSEKSRFGMIFDLGYTPAAKLDEAGPHGDPVSFEFVADADPEYLFVVDRDAAIGRDGNTAQATLDNELINNTKAAKNGNIVYLDSSDWYLVVGGLTTMSKMIDAAGSAYRG